MYGVSDSQMSVFISAAGELDSSQPLESGLTGHERLERRQRGLLDLQAGQGAFHPEEVGGEPHATALEQVVECVDAGAEDVRLPVECAPAFFDEPFGSGDALERLLDRVCDADFIVGEELGHVFGVVLDGVAELLLVEFEPGAGSDFHADLGESVEQAGCARHGSGEEPAEAVVDR